MNPPSTNHQTRATRGGAPVPVSAVLPAALAGLAASTGQPAAAAADALPANPSGVGRDPAASRAVDPSGHESAVAVACEPRLARYVDVTAFVLEHVRPLYAAAGLPFTAETAQAIVASLAPPPRTHADDRRR